MPLIEEQQLESYWKLSKCKTSFKLNDTFGRHPILDNLVWDCMDKLLDHPLVKNSINPLMFRQSMFDQVWVNTYEKNDYQEIHNHGGISKINSGGLYSNSFSFIYLLHNESETGTVFRSRNLSTDSSTNPESKAYEHVEEGTIIMFPYYMDHYVLPATGKRITIAGNVVSSME